MNDFKIDTKNQYNLPEGAKTSTCPLCSEDRKKKKDKCLSLDWEKGFGFCHHCEETIQLHTYEKRKTEKVYKKPPPPKSTDLSEKVISYFKGRGINERALGIAKVSEGMEWMPSARKEANTIQFNYYIKGELINVKYRDAKKGFKLAKDAELIVSGIDRWEHEKEVIIVEGEIDELSYIEAGFANVSSVPNGGNVKSNNLQYIDNCYNFFENKEKIYLSTDSDEAGQGLQKELIRRFGAERCYLVDLGKYKDANEALVAESSAFLQRAILDAKQCPLENVLTYNDIKASLHDFILNGSKKGDTIGLSSFDEIFSTYTSQYVIVTGIPTHGKSDFVDQIVIGHNLSKGYKVAYCSPENKPSFLHVDKICRKLYGKKVQNKEELDSESFKIIENHVQDNFYFVEYEDGYSLENVLAKGAELVKRKGIKILVIDPFNKVPLKGSNRGDSNQYTTDYLNQIDTFCKKHDVLVILVAHPNKMKSVQGEKLAPMPTFYDVKGGGEFYDMAYHGLCVYRDFEENTVTIKVLKCKFQNLGTNGAEAKFMWNPENGRYTEVEEDEISGNITPFWDNKPWIVPIGEEDKQEEENKFITLNEKEDESTRKQREMYEGFDPEIGF